MNIRYNKKCLTVIGLIAFGIFGQHIPSFSQELPIIFNENFAPLLIHNKELNEAAQQKQRYKATLARLKKQIDSGNIPSVSLANERIRHELEFTTLCLPELPNVQKIKLKVLAKKIQNEVKAPIESGYHELEEYFGSSKDFNRLKFDKMYSALQRKVYTQDTGQLVVKRWRDLRNKILEKEFVELIVEEEKAAQDFYHQTAAAIYLATVDSETVLSDSEKSVLKNAMEGERDFKPGPNSMKPPIQWPKVSTKLGKQRVNEIKNTHALWYESNIRRNFYHGRANIGSPLFLGNQIKAIAPQVIIRNNVIRK